MTTGLNKRNPSIFQIFQFICKGKLGRIPGKWVEEKKNKVVTVTMPSGRFT